MKTPFRIGGNTSNIEIKELPDKTLSIEIESDFYKGSIKLNPTPEGFNVTDSQLNISESLLNLIAKISKISE